MVEISWLIPGEPAQTYIARSEFDCKDNVDAFAYRTCVAHRDEVKVGCVLARPLKEQKQ